jgi:arsenate reductase (thioredoxin)
VTTPQVLFVCVRNAGRSQMAAALLERHAGGRVRVRSVGTAPADAVDPTVRDAMDELGIDLTAERPKRLEDDAVREADVLVTMGCGDACPIFPGTRYEDWEMPDPSGKNLDGVRAIPDELDRRVRRLASELTAQA